jgi:serine/threonine-protein kinase
MSASPGTRFGSYEIVEPIGSGGMGEVYRARDTTLGRDVALKVLPASFSNDAMRVARFEQEAKTLASLNHPNIAHIYGLERSDGNTGIAMELVDGQTLVDRMGEGPMPVAEALRIGGQIADALEAAHERAIVHRDLKPGNVKIKPDGTVKVLDFGIAKALDPRFLTGPGPAALTTPAMTEAGFILGTAAYMSPEQARGKFVDQRTDVWAFGCVLFEMLTGKPAFLGEDVTSTLARVLETPAKLDALPTGVPPAVRRTLELCLEKDARKRIADMRDVKLALAGTFATGTTSQLARSRAVPIAAAGVAAALIAAAGAWLLKPAPVAEPKIVTRFNYALPAGISFRAPVTSVLDVAPGGELFAFNGTDAIYVRRMGEIGARAVPGTTGIIADVVISPDGREVAFFRQSPAQLAKVAIGGGAPVALVEPIQIPFGLSWEPDGTLYYGQPDGIWRISHNGGMPEHVVKTESGQQAYGPQLLPGGEWLLFTLAKTGANRWNDADIVVQSLKSGERRVLRSGGFDARYLPSGYLTYAFQNVLFASPFDARTLKLDDERVALVQGVQTALNAPAGGSAFYAVSNNGTLVFVPGAAGSTLGRPQRSLVWVDRQGNTKPLPVRPDDYTMARLSPDGTRVALVVGSTLPATDPPPDIYIFDLKTENLTQLTFNPRPDDAPVWSRDGSRIFYRTYNEDGVGMVAAVSADGGTPELLARSESGNNPMAWSVSPDGETLLLVNAATLQDINLATLGIGKDNTVKTLLDLTEQLSEPSLSPNGQWLLYYQFPETGSADFEVDIRPFPDVRQQRRPVGPGAQPVFSADGSEIFLFDGAGLSVAPVQYSPFRVGGPRKLFRGQFWYGVAGPTGAFGRAWDVDSKNDRFLMITLPAADSTGAPAQAEIDVVVNWLEELKQRVPPAH